MGETIQIQLGKTGNKIGYSFWQQLLQEHNIDQLGKKVNPNSQENQNIAKFFEEQSDQTFRARSIFADMQPFSLQQIMRSDLFNVFSLQNLCYDNISTRNLWPVVFKGSSVIKNMIQESIRRQVEKCQSFAGFYIIQSTCGGAGSGLGSIVSQIIQQQYLKDIGMYFTGLPSPNISNIVVEPYNALLSLGRQDLSGNPKVLFQNQAFFQRTNFKAKSFKETQRSYSFDHINKTLAKAIANITSPSRFACDNNAGLRKICTNLIEFPSRKYLVMNIPYTLIQVDRSIKALLKDKAFNFQNLSLNFSGKSQKKRKWIACYLIFRGPQWRSFDINHKIESLMGQKNRRRWPRLEFKKYFFKEDAPHNYFASVVKSGHKNTENSITSLQTCSIIEQSMTTIHQKSSAMLRRKAFLHWYTSEGVQIQDFTEAQKNLIDIMSDYRSMVEEPECYEEQACQIEE